MAIIKKGKIASSVIVSSTAYVCDFCGHTEVVKNEELKDVQCKKCIQGKMILVSGEAEGIKPEKKKRKDKRD